METKKTTVVCTRLNANQMKTLDAAVAAENVVSKKLAKSLNRKPIKRTRADILATLVESPWHIDAARRNFYEAEVRLEVDNAMNLACLLWRKMSALSRATDGFCEEGGLPENLKVIHGQLEKAGYFISQIAEEYNKCEALFTGLTSTVPHGGAPAKQS